MLKTASPTAAPTMQVSQDVASRGGSVARGSLDRSQDRAEHLRSFAEQGYAFFPNVVPKEKLSELRAGIVEAFERTKRSGSLFSGGGVVAGHLNCFPGRESQFVYDALEQHGILDLLKALSPRPLEELTVGCNLNLPKSVTQHYHIDGAFRHDFLIVNTAVVDTDLENGAIEVIPGSHRRYYKYWRFAVERPYRFSKRLPMRQGDVLVRTSRLWHRGMPNRTSLARPMVAMTFTERPPGEHRDPFQFNDGKIKFYENWYRTDWRGRLRERTFVTAPFTYDAYRFVASLFENEATP
jgi:hypothetical protein